MSLFTEARSALWSYVKGQLTDKAEDAVKDARDHNKLEQDVRALAERYQPRFEALSLAEEFDFEGLNAYLTAHLRQEVSACFNAPDRDQREAARRLLFNSACYYAGADTQAKKDTVQAYLNMVLEVVEHHFLEQVDGKEWFLCGRTVDETVDAVEAFLQRHATQITEQITEAIRYHGSFAEYIDNLQPPWSSENRFHYRNPSLGFYGREQEMKDLNDFLNRRNEDILWMAVTGDGGVGKSKLLYHFCAQVNNLSGWKTVWLSTNSSKRLNDYQSWYYPQGLLVVADYAGEMAERLGDWLCDLSEADSRCRPVRLRLILLEREPLMEWEPQKVTPLWYQTFTGGRERRRAVERYCADPDCLELTGPGDEALKRLVTDYARSKGKPEALTEDRLAFVLEKAHEIDHGNSAPRPLVTLFLADAILDGKEYTHWDMDELLENIIDRYREHWLKTVCKGDEDLFDALEKVLVYATAVGGWNLTELPGPLEAASQTLLESGQMLEPLVCAVNEDPTFRKWLSPLEPDLVGEFYVLDYLNNKRYAKTTLAALVQLFWEQEWEFAMFLNRCIQNYCKEERFQALFRDGLAALQPKAEDDSAALPFAILLVNLTFFQSLEEAAQTVDTLKELSEKRSGSDELALRYAQGLYNLAYKQSPGDAAQTVNTLKELSEEHSGSDEIALRYAKALFNLSNKQSPEDAAQTVNTLKELSETHSGSEEIALTYAQGLFNLSFDQSSEEATQTVNTLKELSEGHSGSDEIALAYAKGLVNLAAKQSPEKAAQTVNTLRELSENHSGSDEFALTYASGLFNLSNKQSPEEAAQTVDRLKELSEEHSGSDEIALQYASGLFNLSNKQSPEAATQTVDTLKELSEEHSGSEEIALTYAQGLFNLSCDQSPKEAAQTVATLNELSEEHSNSDEIVLEYAKGLVNLTCDQSPEEVAQTVNTLKELSEAHSGSDEFALQYAMGLFNLFLDQPYAEATDTVAKLGKLAKQYPNSEEMNSLYTEARDNLAKR